MNFSVVVKALALKVLTPMLAENVLLVMQIVLLVLQTQITVKNAKKDM